jgi:hypothetical protein
MDLPRAHDERRTITPTMELLRASSDLAAKRAAYRIGRIQDQLTFYTKRADTYGGRRDGLRRWTIAAYGVGVLLLPVSGLGVMTTAAGAFASWLTANRYDDLYQSFQVMKTQMDLKDRAAAELALDGTDAPLLLAQFVDNVEGILDGEHETWLAHIGDETPVARSRELPAESPSSTA